MADYEYPRSGEVRFSDRDTAPVNSEERIIKGANFDVEFVLLNQASVTKLDKENPTFTGIMSGGTFENGIINGGTY